MAEVRKPELPFRWRVQSPGRLGSVCPAPPLQCNPLQAAQRLACLRCPDTHARTRLSAAVTSQAHTRCRTTDDALSVSDRPTGVYQVENVPGILQMDLCGQIPECTGSPGGTYIPESGCKTELRGKNQQLLLWIFFFLMQLFNLSSWYGRTDATSDFCLVWLQWHPQFMC